MALSPDLRDDGDERSHLFSRRRERRAGRPRKSAPAATRMRARPLQVGVAPMLRSLSDADGQGCLTSGQDGGDARRRSNTTLREYGGVC